MIEKFFIPSFHLTLPIISYDQIFSFFRFNLLVDDDDASNLKQSFIIITIIFLINYKENCLPTGV